MIQYWNYLREYKNQKKNVLNSVDKVFQSDTDALFIALKCLNIGKNDEVITVSNTAIPTVAAIINTGASVKFADIGKNYQIKID